ncbi:hypothetical protein [Vibrio sp. D431a]|uniref:hypothetical protein n=1 Tax=Vibrio sp. D431a TaxID=2837388 RepID=UPI0025559D7C|nr:hypothetical protein [Vibrio sp. D431a]MDK9789983.1 hypothetical protein [Vibrio sp. D431a]
MSKPKDFRICKSMINEVARQIRIVHKIEIKHKSDIAVDTAFKAICQCAVFSNESSQKVNLVASKLQVKLHELLVALWFHPYAEIWKGEDNQYYTNISDLKKASLSKTQRLWINRTGYTKAKQCLNFSKVLVREAPHALVRSNALP